MLDYHVHPGLSIDAEDFSIPEYCQRALEMGITELCFTPHYEFDPIRSNFDWFVRMNNTVKAMDGPWLESYFQDIEQAKRDFFPLGLTVKAGIEIGFDRGLEENIARIVARYPFDYVLGSIHCVDHVAISSAKESDGYYPHTTLGHVVENYFYTLREAIKSCLFDAIGHLDIYRRHGLKYYGAEVYAAHEPYIDEILALMHENNMIFEVNTSSLRHGHKEFYPCRNILKKAVKLGIREVSLGSDAHRLKELGSGLKQAISEINEFGLDVVVFNGRHKQKYFTAKEELHEED